VTNAELRAMYPDAKTLDECIGRWTNARAIGRETRSQNRAVDRALGLPNTGMSDGRHRKWNKKRETVPGDNPDHMRRMKTRLPTPAVNSIFSIATTSIFSTESDK
jgi:hypothetical protein